MKRLFFCMLFVMGFFTLKAQNDVRKYVTTDTVYFTILVNADNTITASSACYPNDTLFLKSDVSGYGYISSLSSDYKGVITGTGSKANPLLIPLANFILVTHDDDFGNSWTFIKVKDYPQWYIK